MFLCVCVCRQVPAVWLRGRPVRLGPPVSVLTPVVQDQSDQHLLQRGASEGPWQGSLQKHCSRSRSTLLHCTWDICLPVCWCLFTVLLLLQDTSCMSLCLRAASNRTGLLSRVPDWSPPTAHIPVRWAILFLFLISSLFVRLDSDERNKIIRFSLI